MHFPLLNIDYYKVTIPVKDINHGLKAQLEKEGIYSYLQCSSVNRGWEILPGIDQRRIWTQ